ncbi:cell division protein FtsQ/DivIB [Reinekea sp.]|uniref:cell division protein FtsQ/DivIB n=1 Tax=Reinekea sp. TaxID=1970455 RepID=UPI00257FD3B8|nr:cell division protein FtsQ/DivIB [Reinekea sp.]
MAAKKKSNGATRRKASLPIRKWALFSAKVVVGGVVLTACVFSINWLSGLKWEPMPLQGYAIAEPLKFQNSLAVEGVLQGYLTRSLLFLDLLDVQRDLERLPWIAQASVVKIWPGTISVALVEHEPIALWNGQQVLNSKAVPLDKPLVSLDLASLRGPDNSAARVMEQYLQFTQIFAALGAQLVQVSMQARGSWYVQMDDGLTIALGERNVLERSRRVVRLLQSEAYSSERIEYIDARYPNGIAIRIAS